MSTFNLLPPTPPVVLAGANAAVVDPGNGSGGPIAVGGIEYDWLIDGVPFLLWPSEEDPYLRDTKEDVKDQFDSSSEAGEQSFGYWWLRSQASYHGGAGQAYLDSDSRDQVSRVRYYSSSWLDPFTTQGQVTVNPAFSRQAVTRRGSCLVTWSGVPRLATASSVNNQVTVADIPDLLSPDTFTLGASGTCQAICSDGENVYVAVNDHVWKIDADGADTDLGSVTFVGPVSLGFAKARVILTTGPKVYEVDPTGGAVNTLLYTHPSENWRYSAVADGPNGIYLGGYLGPLSELALMTVADTGTGLEIGPPVVQLRTPPSEIINGIVFYLNAFFGLATSNGIRVGQFTPYGQPQYGPLLNPGSPAYSVAGSGSLLYFGGANRVWTVDLGTQIAEGRYAYAQYGSGLNPNSSSDPLVSIEVAVLDGVDHLFGVQNSGAVYYQPAVPGYPADGTLTTSWARFGTVEPKRLHYIRVEGTFPTQATTGASALTVTIESIDGVSKTFQVPGGKTFYEFGVTDFDSSEAFRIVFTVKPGTILRSWQFKARPSPLQYQEFIVPLACWDNETAADGQNVGYVGYAMDRLLRLEEAARSNRIVTAVDRYANTQYRVQVSRCQWRQTVMPGRSDRSGGKVTLVLRLV